MKDAVTKNTPGTQAYSTLVADKEFQEEIMMPSFLHILQSIGKASKSYKFSFYFC
jgi:hypothetical protein